jgi:hypothetical protein
MEPQKSFIKGPGGGEAAAAASPWDCAALVTLEEFKVRLEQAEASWTCPNSSTYNWQLCCFIIGQKLKRFDVVT